MARRPYDATRSGRQRGQRDADERGALPQVVGHLAHDELHHVKMLEITVRLEEGLSGEELDEDAADREHVARVGPA